MENVDKRIVGALILTSLLILCGIIIPLTMGLGTGSMKEQGVANLINFYQKFYWSLVIIWAVIIAFIIMKKNNKYGDSIGFSGIGENPALNVFKKFSTIEITHLSLIFFSVIFFLANLLKTGSFTSLRVLPQQFTKSQSLLFSSLVIPIPENLLAISVGALFILSLTLLAVKYKMNVVTYKTYLYSGLFVLVGLLGVIWHNSVYPGSDIAKEYIFIFWGLIATMSVAIGSMIPALIMHMMNNFFIDFSRLYTNDIVTIVTAITISILILSYWYLKSKNIYEKT